jgi:N6-L-threonylcarbamoyladenine synthase
LFIEAHDRMLILGIESSCDETAASVVRDGRLVMSNVVASQNELHEKFGGVVPEIASRAHIERILPVIDEALMQAKVSLRDLAAIAVGHRPGLIGSLLVGVAAAKTLAWSLAKPLIGIDHVQAHLYAAALDSDPIAFPSLGLVVSGGHTSMYAMASPLQMTLIGRTIDDAIGEAYDKCAAILEIGFPGGPLVDKLAVSGGGDEKAVKLPRSLLDAESLDFTFSGLKTAVLYHVRGFPKGRGPTSHFERSAADLSAKEKADVAASFQKTAVEIVIRKLERAVNFLDAHGQRPRSLVIGGGVSANSRLRSETAKFADHLGLAHRMPKMAYCIDNAAMIAGLAFARLQSGSVDGLDLEAVATTSL